MKAFPMMTRARARRFLLAGAAAALGAWPIVAAVSHASTQSVDMSKIGPEVGRQVASFTLPDHDGRQRTLESLMGAKGVMLVLFRSADW